jgi:hypothetical protein
MKYTFVFIISIIACSLQGQQNTINQDSTLRISYRDSITMISDSIKVMLKLIDEEKIKIYKNYKKKDVKPEINELLVQKKDSTSALNFEISALQEKINQRSKELKKIIFAHQKAERSVKERDSISLIKKSKYDKKYQEILAKEKSGHFIDAIQMAQQLKYEATLQSELFSLIKPSFIAKKLDTIKAENEQRYIQDVQNRLNKMIGQHLLPDDNNYILYYENRINQLKEINLLATDSNLKNDDIFNSKVSQKFLNELIELKKESDILINAYKLLKGDTKSTSCETISQTFQDLSSIKKQEYLNEANFLKNTVGCFYIKITNSDSMKLLGKSLNEIKRKMMEYPVLYRDSKKLDLFCKEIPECIKQK